MAALSGAIKQKKYGDGEAVPSHIPAIGVAAGQTIYNGSLLCVETDGGAADGLLKVGAADISLVCVGYHDGDQVDNSAGSNSDYLIAPKRGIISKGNNGSSISANDVGKPCYIVTDDDVDLSSNGGTRPFAGLIRGMDGTRVWVEVGVAASYTSDLYNAPVLTSQATPFLGAEVNLGALTSGMLKHTVAAGVSTPATAVDKTDYIAPATLAATTNTNGCSLVGIEDASGYYTGTDLETVFDELEAQIGGLTSATYTFGEANVLANDDAVYAALNKLDLKWGDLASVANGEGASLVSIEDASGYYTGTDLETVFDELEAQIGGLTSTTFGFAENNVLADDDALYAALEKLDLRWGDLQSTANGEGASEVGIEDAAGLFTATQVEAALAEVMKFAPQNLADPGDAAAIPVTRSATVPLVIGAGAETNTVAIPTFIGQTLRLYCNAVGGGTRAITFASAINVAGNTVATFNAARDYLEVVGVSIGGALAWEVSVNTAVVLS